MTLGERISSLRNQHNLSQGDLAEKLNVSRQSVSKWETDASIPELDKLLCMSELFDITLDELVKGDTVKNDVSDSTPVTVQNSLGAKRLIGIILLCFGALILILLSALGGFLAGVFFASPFLLCGAVCLIFKNNIGLWCTWAVFLCANLYIRFATGISWRLTQFTFNYDASMNYIRLAFAWIELICFIVMSVVTILRFSKVPLTFTKKQLILFILVLIAFVLLFIPVSIPIPRLANIIFSLREWLRIALFITLLTTILRLIKTKKS